MQTYSSLQAGTYQFSVLPYGGSADQAATSQVCSMVLGGLSLHHSKAGTSARVPSLAKAASDSPEMLPLCD